MQSGSSSLAAVDRTRFSGQLTGGPIDDSRASLVLCPTKIGHSPVVGNIPRETTDQRKAFTVKKTTLLARLILLTLATATLSLGLSACKCPDKQPATTEHPAKSEPPAKSEHPEHPK